MLLGDGGVKGNDRTFLASTKQKCYLFQMLCFIAGISTTFVEVDNRGKRTFCRQTNSFIECKNLYYIVRLLNRDKIHIYNHHITSETCEFVWCPTVSNGTWVARRKGDVFITGNSRIQGSAADQTKIAMQNIYKNKRLKELGWRTLLLVHDEIIGECPVENAKECAKLFSQCMLDSAKELRTGAKCDASYSFRWYGEEVNIDELSV